MTSRASHVSIPVHFLLAAGVLITLVITILVTLLLSGRATPPPISVGDLGGQGSSCGGPERFPCAPGTFCKTRGGDWTKEYGTCVTDPVGASPTTPVQ